MKLSSISLITAALAAIVGSAAAAPCPLEQNSLVDVYICGLPAYKYTGDFQDEKRHVADVIELAAKYEDRAAEYAGKMEWHDKKIKHENDTLALWALHNDYKAEHRRSHSTPAQDHDYASEKNQEALETIHQARLALGETKH